MKALAALAAIAVLLAGCSKDAAEPDDVIVISGDEVTDPPTSAPASSAAGHIAGTVADETIKPIPNATVHLVSRDLKDVTDRNGGFEFVDVPVGSYLIRFNATGHEDAEAVLDVKSGTFTRALVKLHRIPPPEPRIDVIDFEGFADVTSGGFLYTNLACDCSFPFQQDLQGLEALVIEAVMDGGGERGFSVSLRPSQCCSTIHSANLPNPFWTEVLGERIEDTSLRLTVYPWVQPVPETNVSFEVFVSAFYNQPVPPGYTALA